MNNKIANILFWPALAVLLFGIMTLFDENIVRWSPEYINGVVASYQIESSKRGSYISGVRVIRDSQDEVQARGTKLPIREGDYVVLNVGTTRIMRRVVYRIIRLDNSANKAVKVQTPAAGF